YSSERQRSRNKADGDGSSVGAVAAVAEQSSAVPSLVSRPPRPPGSTRGGRRRAERTAVERVVRSRGVQFYSLRFAVEWWPWGLHVGRRTVKTPWDPHLWFSSASSAFGSDLLGDRHCCCCGFGPSRGGVLLHRVCKAHSTSETLRGALRDGAVRSCPLLVLSILPTLLTQRP
ncbi:hypothetical protein GW17_00045334, partial [Ensete ventricosum]